MNKYLRAPLTALAVALSVSSFSVVNSQPVAAQAQEFFCGSRWRKEGDVGYPATMVRHRNGSTPIIIWTEKSRINNIWTPLRRCQAVSQRFEELNRQHKLHTLAVGKVNNQSVICGLGLGEGSCNSNNTLLTVTDGKDPERLLDELLNTRTNASGAEVYLSGNDVGRVVIQKDSDGVVRVSMEDIIRAHLSVPSRESQPQPESIW